MAAPTIHPWFGYHTGTHSVAETAEIQDWLGATIQAVRDWCEACRLSAMEAGIPAPESLGDAPNFLALLELIGKSTCPPVSWICSEYLPELRKGASELEQRTSAYWREYCGLAQIYGEGYVTLSAVTLNETLSRHTSELHARIQGQP